MSDLVSRYLAAFEIAHDEAAIRFKHHQLVHLHSQIVRDGCLLNRFVPERKNIVAKQSAANNKALEGIERTVLSRSLNDQLRKLATPGWESRLTMAVRPFPELALALQASTVNISHAMRWSGVAISHRDVIFLDAKLSLLVVVVGCLQIDDACMGLLVRETALLSEAKYWSKWTVKPDVCYHILDDSNLVYHVDFHRYAGEVLEILV